MTALALAALVFVPLLIEARRAARLERAQLERGGLEPSGDVYGAMRVAYPAAFAVMIVESAIRGLPGRGWMAAGLACFVAAKVIKWWAILTLGPLWTFRVIVVPGTTLVDGGPYRFLRHPNYVGVAGELVGLALTTGATVSGPLAIVLFGTLLKRRVAVEERALDSTARHPPCSL
jgi:methyltransferase